MELLEYGLNNWYFQKRDSFLGQEDDLQMDYHTLVDTECFKEYTKKSQIMEKIRRKHFHYLATWIRHTRKITKASEDLKPSIKFTLESGENGVMPFLDVQVGVKLAAYS